MGQKDIFGRVLKFSKTDIADSLATSAVLEMGEGREQQPLAVITGATVEWTEVVDTTELAMDPKDDVYAPMFAHLLKEKDE